jgi:hypothetical protein
MTRDEAAATIRDFAASGELGSRTARDLSRAVDVLEQLPELMGAKAAAEVLGTTAGNLKRWTTLPEPLYSPDHPDRRRRVATGSLYDAEQIRALARSRAAAAR